MAATEEQRLGEPVGPTTSSRDAPRKARDVIPGGQPSKDLYGVPVVLQMYTLEERTGHKLRRPCEVCGKEFLIAGMKRHMATHRDDDSDAGNS